MVKPTLYIMCGLPFSGKTVLTKKLVDKSGLAYVNLDEIKFSHGFEWIEDDQMTEADWKKIFAMAYTQTLKFLEDGKSVIFDCANQDRTARDELRKLAEPSQYPTKVIHMHIPLDIIKQRYLTNKETKERFDLPERIFQAAIDTYEIPTADENVISFDENTNVDDWIKVNF